MRSSVIIIGAGPAGLTAARELAQRGAAPLVVEKSGLVGGIARTELHRGYRFDIGGHRFYTKVPEVQRLWQALSGDDLLQVSRLSRIFYEGRFFHYPLSLPNVLANLGPVRSLGMVASYLKWRLRPYPREDTFEEWVTNRFGRRLYRTFFEAYTEKVWGMPCREIAAEWAVQRIAGLSFPRAVAHALRPAQATTVKSLIDTFHYPVLGPGMLWERFASAVESDGGQVRLGYDAVRLLRRGKRVTQVVVQRDGQEEALDAAHVISSMPLSHLVSRLDPPAPEPVRLAAQRLRYRAFLLVGLIVRRAALFPDNWIYIHTPDVRVGRIQNFKNWSQAMVPAPDRSSLGMEYFCDEGDDLWTAPDGALVELATRELEMLGLGRRAEVEDGVVIRQPMAYPVYDREYRDHLGTIRAYLEMFENLQTVGRNGMHRYNNQDHSMLTGLLAARNVFGERNDLWQVNTERSYHEEVAIPARVQPAERALRA